ncbi:coatomer subunit zeta-2 [Silurus meridionalis]|nr:coatomer subunit zeta-2 [Silurus meridionalis]
MDSAALYYDTELYPSMKEQKNFEKNVFNKTHKADNEIAFLEGMTIVYKSSIDLFFYVVGSAQENELMLMAVLNCLFESLNQILRKNVEKRCLLDNMDGAFLVVDEIIDGGVILESDPQQVVEKVNYRTDDNPLSEHSVAQKVVNQNSFKYLAYKAVYMEKDTVSADEKSLLHPYIYIYIRYL